MKSIYQQAFHELAKRAEAEPTICVAYSGGKDSLAVMDMCCKTFKTVRAFFMYAAPELEVCNRQLRFAKERWGVDVVKIPDWRRVNDLRSGMWCDETAWLTELPELTLREGLAYGIDACGCKLLADGMKNADGLKRRQFFANIRDGKHAPFWENVLHPIRHWRKKDVLDYLSVNKIPLPDAEKGAVTSGVGLDHNSLCWLHDKHPADFQKLLRWFPYAEAAIQRREWFGVA